MSNSPDRLEPTSRIRDLGAQAEQQEPMQVSRRRKAPRKIEEPVAQETLIGEEPDHRFEDEA